MSTVNVNERLAALTAAGTSVWLDEIRRGLVESGELERLVREDCLRGVTSNPAIFEKAILGSSEYDDQMAELTAAGADARGIYRAIATRDVQDACDVLRAVFDETDGYDGYVSLEVDPDLAHDTDKTIIQAREYWEAVDRPNLMIKIPGTDAGIPAIEQAISEGINVNVTLLFAVEAYAKIAEAFIRGLERRREQGEDVTSIHSVASFFVSRVDSEVDKRLKKLGREDLRGKAGLANARAAYKRFKEIFHGERFAALLAAGAPVQRPLWASTGVKDPAYKDTMYVEELVAPETVNTMPTATLFAAAQHAEITGEATADRDPTPDLHALAEAGIDMEDVTRKLLEDGIAKFVAPMEQLLAGVESKREAILTGRPDTIESVLPEELEGPIADRIAHATEQEVARRIWQLDETLWGPTGQPEVADRLGWLTVTDITRDALDDLEQFVRDVRDAGYTDVVLLGMGGSSLAPEVIRRSFADRARGLPLHVLDSTDAQAVRDVEVAVDNPFFVVSSKSGGTIETLSHFRYFWDKHPEGERFCAVTDPDSPLEALAKEHGFRRVWLNDPHIGGRYSALSFFGIVPAALMGADVVALLDRADVARESCNHFDSSRGNPGLWLGVALGELARQGRDKLTFAIDPPVSSFGIWAEQLVAESSGKAGKGILPVADEPLGDVASYGRDRVFLHLKVRDEDKHSERLSDLAEAGHPVITVNIEDHPADLGRLFFFAEFATAVAGWALGINPFDQPNVQEAKDATKAVLDGGGDPTASRVLSSAQVLSELLHGGPPLYYAVLGYLPPSDDVDDAVRELRDAIRRRTTAATTWGYGPRYLHSTGQLHKGGPKLGRFLQLLAASEDLPVPGEPYTFEELKRAQAMGDLATLHHHGLPAWQLPVTGDPASFIRDLAAEVRDLA
jgi:transaldolase/glucose-6-phosphate isomerase